MTPPPDARCYTVADILAKLHMSYRTFHRLKTAGRLPFCEEIRPRLGNISRYRADLVDRYLRNEWYDGIAVLGRRRRA